MQLPYGFLTFAKDQINKLQLFQNSAVHIATGSVRITAIDHLHTEAKVLNVVKHLRMLCAYLLATGSNSPSGLRAYKHQTHTTDCQHGRTVDGCIRDIRLVWKMT